MMSTDLRAGELGRIAHRTLFDRGDLGRDADDDRRFGAEERAQPRALAGDLLDEVAEHRFGHFEVRDDAVAQRPDRLDVARRLAEHQPRLFAHGERSVRAHVLGDHGRLAQHDAFALDVNEDVGGTQIDPDVDDSDSRTGAVRPHRFDSSVR